MFAPGRLGGQRLRRPPRPARESLELRRSRRRRPLYGPSPNRTETPPELDLRHSTQRPLGSALAVPPHIGEAYEVALGFAFLMEDEVEAALVVVAACLLDRAYPDLAALVREFPHNPA